MVVTKKLSVSSHPSLQRPCFCSHVPTLHSFTRKCMETEEADSELLCAQSTHSLSSLLSSLWIPYSPRFLPSTQRVALWDARDAPPCTSKVGGGYKQRRISDAQTFPSACRSSLIPLGLVRVRNWRSLRQLWEEEAGARGTLNVWVLSATAYWVRGRPSAPWTAAPAQGTPATALTP